MTIATEAAGRPADEPCEHHVFGIKPSRAGTEWAVYSFFCFWIREPVRFRRVRVLWANFSAALPCPWQFHFHEALYRYFHL